MNLTYEELLEKAGVKADSFSLVWREGLSFNKTSVDLEIQLEPYLLKSETVKQWPGTQLSKQSATMRTYQVNQESLNILKTAVNDIYQWIAPNYPEDLAFYAGGQVWFASISHEKDSWFTE